MVTEIPTCNILLNGAPRAFPVLLVVSIPLLVLNLLLMLLNKQFLAPDK